MKSYFANLIPDSEEIETFALWAFGECFRDEGLFNTGIDFMTEWNKRHGDVLYLFPHGIMGDDIPKMVKVWRDR